MKIIVRVTFSSNTPSFKSRAQYQTQKLWQLHDYYCALLVLLLLLLLAVVSSVSGVQMLPLCTGLLSVPHE